MTRVTQYSAKLDDIHIVVDGEARCGKLMLSHNYLNIRPDVWTAEDRDTLLKFHPRVVCEKCLAKIQEEYEEFY